MSKYIQIIDRLFQATSSGIRPSLENAHALNRALDFPTGSYATIHIAGSNGKGSVATKIAKAFEYSGYRVGLYTSPHLFSFRERIAIDSHLIPEEAIVEGMEKIFSVNEQLRLDPTFFEMTTFLAFDHFRKEKVDIAIIETGIGGRLDATNLISPLLTLITSISREHTQILGEDLEQIATEKAGIIKEKVPLILGPKARCQSIYNRAHELNSPVFASKKISYFYDEENSAIAELALSRAQLFFTLDQTAIEQALPIRPSCRFERIENVIFDVAHNPEAIFYLLQALHTFFPQGSFRFLVGFSKDKEYAQCLDLITTVATHLHLVEAATPRAASTDELKSLLKEDFTTHSSVEEGVKEAYATALAQNEILVICGSFYIMAEAKRVVTQIQPPADLSEKTFPSVLSSSVI